MIPNLENLLRNANHVQLIIDGVPMALTAAPERSSHRPEGEKGQNSFSLEGAIWTMRFGGHLAYDQDSVGHHDIHAMLAQPHQYIDAVTLMSMGRRQRAIPPQQDLAHFEFAELPDANESRDEIISDEGRARILSHARKLESEAAKLRAQGQIAKATEITHEIDRIHKELRKHRFLGHNAEFTNYRERARKCVTIGIKRAIQSIAQVHPTLAKHFEKSIETGSSCRYNPEHETKWEL